MFVGAKKRTAGKAANSKPRAAKAAASIRERQAKLMANKRVGERNIEVPPVVDPDRRARAERDIYFALQTYFPDKFTGAFTPDRREMVEAILSCAREGRYQAIAAPRGEGKTTIVECVAILCLLFGLRKCVMIIAATGRDAKRILRNIKDQLEYNDLLLADFPEVCAPIRALEGANNRANMQTAGGERTRIRWSGDLVVLPTVAGSIASGSVLTTAGITGAIRGFRVNSLRPDLVVIDDAETRASANSPDQLDKRERTIEQDIAGLAGPGESIASVMLCTVSNRICLAYRYTDPTIKPNWNGRRYKMLAVPPERADLWEEYTNLRQKGKQLGTDLNGREATRFYLSKRAEMDAGAVVSNPDRYEHKVLDDGEPAEVSAVQHAYNLIADRGYENFATEYQNDPPADDDIEAHALTEKHVLSAINGMGRGIIPEGAFAITAGIDVGKFALHYTVAAWMPGGTGFVIDYGVEDVFHADSIGIDAALFQAFSKWRERVLISDPYRTAAGLTMTPAVALIDSGNWDFAIFNAIKAFGGNPFRASKGFGQSHSQSPFEAPTPRTKHKLLGEHWYAKRHQSGLWLWGLDADYWKEQVHNRLLTTQGQLGSLSLFGDANSNHNKFAKHLTAEIKKREFVQGKGFREFWDTLRRDNHWLDSTYMAVAAGSMVGVKLLPSTKPRQIPPHKKQKPGQQPPAQKPNPQRPKLGKRAGGWKVSAW